MIQKNLEKIIKMIILVLSLAFGLFLEETKFIYIGVLVYFLVSIFFKYKKNNI